ncbi:MAG: energy-coupling factor transporter ATPase [Oscillospiraceae bacterium]|nr:energy-coupling factor transporter ATPase [Oscillospiraceae bacterium]
MEPIIKVEDVYFSYGGDGAPDALRGVSLDVAPGSFVVIIGRNGSGKSTLAKLLNGIYTPRAGRVLVGGMDARDSEKLLSIRRLVGMVFQNPDNQLVASVVEEDVAFAPENLGVEPAEIRRRVDAALKQVDMYEYRHHSPHLLSGGQKQRVALAGVIAQDARCIVLDEPTAMLDPSGRREVISAIKRLCRDFGTTIILITHHMEEGSSADKLCVMDAGKIVMQGTPREIFARAGELEALGLTVPDAVNLLSQLREEGLPVPQGALTLDECAGAIFAALQKEQECRQ